MSMRDVIKSITDRIHDTASVKNVYGDPITAQGKTVIPVAQVKYGFGGGGGQEGEPSNRRTQANLAEEEWMGEVVVERW